MWRTLAIAALCMALAPATASAQSGDTLFSRQTKWNVEESWNNDKLIYTFAPNGTFQSNSGSNRSTGSWMRDRNAFVMLWPLYDHAVYVGTINGREIRGQGFDAKGKSFGTFVFRLIP